ncbi:MAG: GerMN domain-containing protein [Desulfuromonadales bacterium]|nr:GerMN domain-containing protein [Desulfuromonadales bacterium]
MPPVRRKRSSINLLVPFLIIALVFGALLWNKYRTTRMINPKPTAQTPLGKRTVVLFYVDEGSRLAREARELDPCSDTTACVKETLDELFYGPVGELDEALPEGSVVNAVRIEGDTAVVDVNRNFVDEMPAGSSAEMMAVYSIVDTLCLNFPKITRVRLTVAGEGKITLEHLDLSDPLSADYTLEAPATPSGSRTAKPSKPDTTKEKP